MDNLCSGLKVLDLTNNLAGPYAAGLLANYGAEVIHVERPVIGDDSRYFAPRVDGVSFAYMLVNRGKKSLVLDLKDPRAIEIIKKLAAEADVLMEAYRPGVMKRLGLDYDEIKKINPNIIYCSVSAYGQKGPYASRPGYDVIAQAVSGIMYMTGEEDGPPMKVGASIGDFMGSLVAFGMIGHALNYRRATGKGQHLDVSLARILMWMTVRLDYMITGKMDHRNGNHHTTLAPYGIFCGNNGEAIIIGALSEGLWSKLCMVMGRPDLITDPKFVTNDKRCDNLKEMVAIIEDWLKGFESIREPEKMIMDAGIPCARIYDHKDIYEDPHFQEAGWFTHIPSPDSVKSLRGKDYPSVPFEFSEVKPEYKAAPDFGQHNHEILEKLGYSAEEVDALEKEWADKVLAKRKK